MVGWVGGCVVDVWVSGSQGEVVSVTAKERDTIDVTGGKITHPCG